MAVTSKQENVSLALLLLIIVLHVVHQATVSNAAKVIISLGESVPSVNLTAKIVSALLSALRQKMDITFSLDIAARRMENLRSAALLA